MRDYLISEDLYKMLLSAVGSADAKSTAHGVHLHQSYIALSNLKPIEAKEAE
jgi:hypothetical protein